MSEQSFRLFVLLSLQRPSGLLPLKLSIVLYFLPAFLVPVNFLLLYCDIDNIVKPLLELSPALHVLHEVTVEVLPNIP